MATDSRQTRGVPFAKAVGIVVRSDALAERRPRAIAFVWGGKVRPAPSLPYGRWKKELAAAA
jgi:hypothetical protein